MNGTRRKLLVGIFQLSVAFAAGCAAIYYQKKTGDKLNPWIVGAWCFMAAFAATHIAVKLVDARRYGLAATFPPLSRIFYVSAVTVAVVAAMVIGGIVFFGFILPQMPQSLIDAFHKTNR